MARSLNKAMIIGNLGSDPELRSIGTGARVANFSVATSRSWTGRDGSQQEKTEWHRIVAWEKLAEIAERFLRKGDRVYVEGEIEYRSYEDKDGVTKYMTEIRARDLVMLGGNRDGGGDFGGGSAERGARQPQASGRGAAKEEGGYGDFDGGKFPEDDDLPF